MKPTYNHSKACSPGQYLSIVSLSPIRVIRLLAYKCQQYRPIVPPESSSRKIACDESQYYCSGRERDEDGTRRNDSRGLSGIQIRARWTYNSIESAALLHDAIAWIGSHNDSDGHLLAKPPSPQMSIMKDLFPFFTALTCRWYSLFNEPAQQIPDPDLIPKNVQCSEDLSIVGEDGSARGRRYRRISIA